MMSKSAPWTLNKILVLLLTGTFLGLAGDLRYEHVDQVRNHWTAWIPIVYSGAMVVIGLLGLLRWDRHGREVLFYAFQATLAVAVAITLWSGYEFFRDVWRQRDSIRAT